MSISNLSSLLNNQLLQFNVIKVNGLGDLSCGFKLAQMVHVLGRVALEQIVIVTNDPEEMKRFDEKRRFRIEPSFIQKNHNPFFSPPPVLNVIENVALQIVVPASSSFDAGLQLQRPIKTLALYEYGFDPVRWDFLPPEMVQAYSLGLGQSNLGILLDLDWEREHELSKEENRLKRLMELKGISSPLLEFILGEKSEEPLLRFADRAFLFTAYGPLQLDFVKALCEMQQKPKDYVFILPGFNQEIAKIEELAKKYAFNRLVLYLNKEKREVSLSEGTRTMRLYLDILSHQDFSLVSLASEPETLCMGDQSLGEAISQNKCFAYVEKPHKSSLSHVISAWYRQARPVITYDGQANVDFSQKIRRIFENKEEFSKINKEICRHFQCYPKIEKILMKMLLSTPQNPLISLVKEKEFQVDKLELNKHYILNNAQILPLKIHTETGEAEHPDLKAVTCMSRLLGHDTYYLQLIKKPAS